MEIKNSTQMNSTSFGMALKKPKDLEAFVKATGADRVGIAGRIRRRGIQQLEKELKSCEHADVEFIRENGKNVYLVLNNHYNGGKIITTFDKYSDGLIMSPFNAAQNKIDDAIANKKGVRRFLSVAANGLKVLYHTIKTITVNPKQALPSPLLTAAEESKKADKAIRAEIKAAKKAAVAEHIKAQKAREAKEKAMSKMKKIFGE